MELFYSNASIREAMIEIKGFEWEEDYRTAARQAIKEILEGIMEHCVDYQ